MAYEDMDKNGPYELSENNKKKDFFLTPSCYGGLLTVDYKLNIKIIFNTLLTFNEEFNIPLDFYERQNASVNNNNNDNHNEEDNNTITGQNNNSNSNNDAGEDAPPPVYNINEH